MVITRTRPTGCTRRTPGTPRASVFLVKAAEIVVAALALDQRVRTPEVES
jgi:hypothetical protein